MIETSIDTIGGRIREARTLKRLTISEMAPMLGITRTYLAIVERGERNPSQVLLQKIADTTGTSCLWLRTGKTETETDPEMYAIASYTENSNAIQIRFFHGKKDKMKHRLYDIIEQDFQEKRSNDSPSELCINMTERSDGSIHAICKYNNQTTIYNITYAADQLPQERTEYAET